MGYACFNIIHIGRFTAYYSLVILLYDKFRGFVEDLNKLGNQLNTANKMTIFSIVGLVVANFKIVSTMPLHFVFNGFIL